MTTAYQRHADLRLTSLSGDGVALHLGSRRYFTVSGTGLAILEALAEPRSLEQLADVLTARWDVSNADALASAERFVDRCVAAGLVNKLDRE